MKDNQTKLIVFINIEYKELIRLFLIVGYGIFIENILGFVIIFSKLLKLDIMLNIIGFIQLDTCINLFRKLFHLFRLHIIINASISNPIITIIMTISIFNNKRVRMRFGLIIVRYVIVPQLKMRNLEVRLLELLYLHQLN